MIKLVINKLKEYWFDEEMQSNLKKMSNEEVDVNKIKDKIRKFNNTLGLTNFIELNVEKNN